MKICINVLLLLLVVSCTSENSFNSYSTLKNGNVLIDVDNLNYEKSIIIDSIFRLRKIVKLESNEESFIGSYDKLLIEENRVYIMDSSITFSIFVFDFEGNFLFKISSFGEGPDEYVELRDFTVSSNTKTIDVLDFGGKKLLRFDKQNGKPVETERLDRNVYYRSLERIDGGYVVNHANNCGVLQDCFNVSFLGNDLKVQSSSLAMNSYLKNYDFKGDPHFSRNADQVYFKEIFNDTIYEILPGSKELRAAFSIDFGDFRMPHDFKYSKKNSNLNEAIQFSLNNNLTLGIKDFFVADSYLYFRYGVPGLREVIVDLNSMENFSFQRFVTSNFLYAGTVTAVFRDEFIKVLTSEEVNSLVKNYYSTKDSLKVREEYSEFYEIAKGIDVESNGILTFLTPNF